MKTMTVSDFQKGEFCDFESEITLWKDEDIMLWVDIPEDKNSTLEQCIDKINEILSWLDENKNVIVEAILDSNIFSNIQEWTSETVTREDFAKTLEPIELAISLKWNQTMIYVGCNQDYFNGHCICVYLNDKNEITGCGLEG